MKSDRVLVLDQGSVLEYDSPETLKQNPDSEFSQLLKEIKKKKKD
jgi:ABC-type multidrug transport system fused ATPase/permease subunit